MSDPAAFQNEFRYVFFAPPERFDETVAFYRDVLQLPILGGFGESPTEMRGTYVQAAKGVLEIIADPGESELKRQALGPGQSFQPAQGGYLLIEVESVEDLHRRLTQEGAPIRGAVTDWPWGFRDFRIQDPCGNTLCLFSRR
jgi:predicted enzyme related to lactoylglutathione lyase